MIIFGREILQSFYKIAVTKRSPIVTVDYSGMLRLETNPSLDKEFDSLLPLMYRELRSIAERFLRMEPRNHTLQPTALVHEVYLKFSKSPGMSFLDRNHFLALAARSMRQILVDHARKRRASKRGLAHRVDLDGKLDAVAERCKATLALDDALSSLAKVDEQRAQLLEMRFFAGMTADGIAECTAIPVHKIRTELRIALAWLRREMEA